MKMELSIHNVTSIKVHRERDLKSAFMKMLRITGENGSTTDVTMYSAAQVDLEIKDAGNPLLEALEGMVDFYEDQVDTYGEGFPLEPSCNECTQGITPINLEKRCALHVAKLAIKTAKGE